MCTSSVHNLRLCNCISFNVDRCRHGEVAIKKKSISPDESVVIPKICINSSWKTVCDWNWSYTDATVACRHSGASSYGRFQIHVLEMTSIIIMFCIYR